MFGDREAADRPVLYVWNLGDEAANLVSGPLLGPGDDGVHRLGDGDMMIW